MVWCCTNNRYKKGIYILKTYWILCSKYDNHLMFNNEHNWEIYYETDLISIRIFTSIVYKVCIWAPKSTRAWFITLLRSVHLLCEAQEYNHGMMVNKHGPRKDKAAVDLQPSPSYCKPLHKETCIKNELLTSHGYILKAHIKSAHHLIMLCLDLLT